MIVQEIISETLVKTYSDRGVYIHGGYPEADYEESIDPIALHRVFTETDIPIADDTQLTEEDYATIGRIMLGDEEEHE